MANCRYEVGNVVLPLGTRQATQRLTPNSDTSVDGSPDDGCEIHLDSANGGFHLRLGVADFWLVAGSLILLLVANLIKGL